MSSVKTKSQYLKSRNKSGSYSSNIKSEFSKIFWPSKQDVIKASISIIIFVMFFVGFVALSDLLLSKVFFKFKGI